MIPRRTSGKRFLLAGLLGAWAAAAAAHAAADSSPFGIRGRIEAFVRERAAVAPTRIEIPSLEVFALSPAPKAPVSVHLRTHPRQRMLGSVPITVSLESEGRTLRRATVAVRVQADAPAVLAGRPLRRGQLLRAADLVVEPRDLASLPPGFVADPRRLVGLRLRRSVAAGTPLEEGWLEQPPLVERGQNVKLTLRHGPLRIEARGRARQPGREGEWIWVVNADSKRELWGRVGADGAIHVEF